MCNICCCCRQAIFKESQKLKNQRKILTRYDVITNQRWQMAALKNKILLSPKTVKN